MCADPVYSFWEGMNKSCPSPTSLLLSSQPIQNQLIILKELDSQTRSQKAWDKSIKNYSVEIVRLSNIIKRSST
jgi:hypothetical protein